MKIDELLPEVKKIEVEILCVIDDFCKKNNICYSLAYGTLIGAIRHKGFIPWDDDIDLWMSRDDYNRFIESWLKNPVEGYILQNTDLESDFNQNFTKIRKDNSAFIQSEEEKQKHYHKGIFVDIFPLDRVSKTKVGIVKQKIYAVLTMLFYRKFSPPNERGLKKIISKMLLTIVPKSQYDNLRKYFEKKYLSLCGDQTCKFISNSTYECLNLYYDFDMMDTFVDLEFEGKRFPAVAKWDHALKVEYGDYMKLPPKEERVWKHNPLLINFEKNYSNDIL